MQIRTSGRFRYVREVVCHGRGVTDGAGVIGLAESIGGPRALFEGAAPEVEAAFLKLRDTADRVLGERAWPMVVCYRMRLGVK